MRAKATTFGLARKPPELSWRALLGGSMLAGIGLTMSLFIAQIAFAGDALNSAKLGILIASLLSATAGAGVLIGLNRRSVKGAPNGV